MIRGYVVGLDLSLRAPAAVAIPVGWKPGDWRKIRYRLGAPPEPQSADDVVGQLKRYVYIVEWVDEFLRDIGVLGVRAADGGVFIEAYGFSKNNAQSSRIMESGGSVKTHLYRRWGIVAQSVPSSTARKYLLGFNPNKTTGHDAKQVVLHTLYKRLKSPTWGEDVSDAFVVANYGYSVLGHTGIALNVRKTAPTTKEGKHATRGRRSLPRPGSGVGKAGARQPRSGSRTQTRVGRCAAVPAVRRGVVSTSRQRKVRHARHAA